ncbi:MAG TPA: ABC transporter permease [Candidatus Saccharibacteria bacterium]|nr:ABC transporter permease [Candidatus Saccharibacteria bacterium]
MNISSKMNQSFWSLVRELAVTDFKIKYQGSIIGYAWSLVKPLAMFGVLYLVFTVFVRIGSGIQHYALYLLLGIVLWTYFADATTTSMRAVADKGDMMRKVYFPRIAIIIAASISSSITLLLNLIVVFVFIVVARIVPSWNVLWFIPLLIELFVLCLGLAFILSALFVKYRDIGHIWEVALQLLFYASAIIYPLNIVPIRFQKFILLNPITQIVQDARYVLVTKESITANQILQTPLVLIPYIIPFALVVVGYFYFEKSAKNFAEEA